MAFKKSLTNRQIAHLFNSLTAALIIKKKNRFRIIAYQRAAAAIANLSVEARTFWQNQQLTQIPGVGANIAAHLDELFTTGRAKHFDQILKGLPPALFELLKIPGIGPKMAFKLCQKLKIVKAQSAVEKLKKAALKHKISCIEGFGEKTEEEILLSIKTLKKTEQRLLLPMAQAVGNRLLNYLKKLPAVKKANLLGSLRRQSATIGDIDIAVASSQPSLVIDWFIKYPQVIRVVEAGQKKARINISGNYQIDLMVEPPESYGTLLQHLTGSKQHNITFREIAQKKGLNISEHGIKVKDKKGRLRKKKLALEKDVYQLLNMAWIPPELRENKGEIEAAQKQQLPQLVKLSDLKGDLHVHSDFNIETSHDLGTDPMKDYVQAALKLNYQYLSFSEHNPSLSQHSQKQIINLLKRKKERIEQLNYSLKKEGQKRKNKLFIFNSLEIDIRPDGQRAISDQALTWLDFALVAIHSSFKMDKKAMTKRILRGLDHPKIKILAHPTARKLNKRESIKVDWPQIFDFCQKKNKYLEINSFPDRLDLPDVLVREAIKNGVKLVLGTDAHQASQLQLMPYGVAMAQRGWAEKGDILNTLSYNKISKLLWKS